MNGHDDVPILRLKPTHRGLNLNVTDYAARNISNDHDFTKLFTPSSSPSVKPTKAPTGKPSSKPTIRPSPIPTMKPTVSPSITPTTSPSEGPTARPTTSPSEGPTARPTPSPTPPTSMSCPDLLINNDGDDSLNITKYETSFDYEVVTPSENVSISDALQVLEARILEHMASSFLACQTQTDSTSNNRNLEETNSGEIVQIDSAPFDVEDKINVECMEDTGVTADGNVKCTPIVGSMTFYSDCATCPYPEADILAAIESACDNNLYVDGNIIKQVNYIGSREPLTVELNMGNGDNRTQRSLGFGLSFAFVLAAVAAAMSVLYNRWRNKKHKQYEDMTGGTGKKTYDFDEVSLDQVSRDFDADTTQNTINLSDLLTLSEEDDGGINVLWRK